MKQAILEREKGQSLAEILIAVAIGAIIAASAVGAVLFTVRSNQQNRASQTASTLGQELLDNVRSVSEGKWQTLYCLNSTACLPTKGPGTQYTLAVYKVLSGTVAVTNGLPSVNGSGTTFNADLVVNDKIIINSLPFTVNSIASDISLTLNANYSGSTASGLTAYRDFSFRTGTESVSADNIVYSRSFAAENVYRDACGTGTMCDTDSNNFRDVACGGDNSTTPVESSCTGSQTGVLEDPSTQKITAKVTWQQGGSHQVLISEYVTRAKNDINRFSDWSGSAGVGGPVSQPSKDYSSQSGLDTTSSPGSLKLAP